GSLGTSGKWAEKLIITDDIGAICLAIYDISIWPPQIRSTLKETECD
ncbi:unnamed protein product, partial [Didymodactylos carnosus]